MKKLLFVCLGGLLGLFSLNAYAVDVTNGPLQQDPSLCAYGYNPNCNRGNNNPPPKRVIETTIIHKASKYGALASSLKTGSVGGSVNMDSLAEAKKAAIRQCGGKDCKVVTWVRNGCIAAATGKKGKQFLLADVAGTLGNTEQAAMKKCQAEGASDCQIVIPETCSVPEGMYN